MSRGAEGGDNRLRVEVLQPTGVQSGGVFPGVFVVGSREEADFDVNACRRILQQDTRAGGEPGPGASGEYLDVGDVNLVEPRCCSNYLFVEPLGLRQQVRWREVEGSLIFRYTGGSLYDVLAGIRFDVFALIVFAGVCFGISLVVFIRADVGEVVENGA